MVSIRPLCVEELAEILAIQFDEERSLHLTQIGIQNTQIGVQNTQKKWSIGHVRMFQSHRDHRQGRPSSSVNHGGSDEAS